MAKTKTIPRKHKMPGLEGSTTEKLLCPFCSQTFATMDQRNRHIIECTDSRLFCEFCPFNTKKRAYLQKHIKNMHCSVSIDEELKSPKETSAQSCDDNNNHKEISTKRGTESNHSESEEDSDHNDSDNSVGDDDDKAMDQSKCLFPDISSDEIIEQSDQDIRVVEAKDKDVVKPNVTVAGSNIVENDKSKEPLEAGRTVRNATTPTPVHTPKKKLTNLRRRLVANIVPRPPKAKVPVVQVRRPEKEMETLMKTKYIKIYTEYEKDELIS